MGVVRTKHKYSKNGVQVVVKDEEESKAKRSDWLPARSNGKNDV